MLSDPLPAYLFILCTVLLGPTCVFLSSQSMCTTISGHDFTTSRSPRTMCSQDLTPASPDRCQVHDHGTFAVVLVLPLLSHHNPPRSFCLFKYSLGTNKCRTPPKDTEIRIALMASSSVLRSTIEWKGPKNWSVESG